MTRGNLPSLLLVDKELFLVVVSQDIADLVAAS